MLHLVHGDVPFDAPGTCTPAYSARASIPRNLDSGRKGSTPQLLSVAWGASVAKEDSGLTQKMKKRPGLGVKPTSQYTRLVSTVASTKE